MSIAHLPTGTPSVMSVMNPGKSTEMRAAHRTRAGMNIRARPGMVGRAVVMNMAPTADTVEALRIGRGAMASVTMEEAVVTEEAMVIITTVVAMARPVVGTVEAVAMVPAVDRATVVASVTMEVEAVAMVEAAIMATAVVGVTMGEAVATVAAVMDMDRAMVEDDTTGIESAMASNPMKLMDKAVIAVTI